jgi:hypothetical protein
MYVCNIPAVSLVLDSLDDSHCLQGRPCLITEDLTTEPDEQDRAFLASVLEDHRLHALLDVSFSSLLGIDK